MSAGWFNTLIDRKEGVPLEWAAREEMEQEVRDSVDNGRRVCYGSCCHKLQAGEQHRQHALCQRIEKFLEEAIQARNEDLANSACVYLNLAGTLLYHLQMWLLLKADRMREAWEQLVEAQSALTFVLRFRPDEQLQKWYAQLLDSERLLFPPQIFMSVSHYWDYAVCSICKQECGTCEHVAGQLYMGQRCVKQPHEIIAANHVAIVEHPRDKACRIVEIPGDDGYVHCTLTRRRVRKAKSKDEGVSACILRAR